MFSMLSFFKDINLLHFLITNKSNFYNIQLFRFVSISTNYRVIFLGRGISLTELRKLPLLENVTS